MPLTPGIASSEEERYRFVCRSRSPRRERGFGGDVGDNRGASDAETEPAIETSPSEPETEPATETSWPRDLQPGEKPTWPEWLERNWQEAVDRQKKKRSYDPA